MLERLATAGAGGGGESLANEVDQLRSQVRRRFFYFVFFSMPVFSFSAPPQSLSLRDE
jgi:hypothetical protein